MLSLYMVPNSEDFRSNMLELFRDASLQNRSFIEITAGTLHQMVGGYPAKDGNHRTSACCQVMYDLQRSSDEIISAPVSSEVTGILYDCMQVL